VLLSIREGTRGFDEIRAAGRYWVQDRMEKMQAKRADRVDMLDKFFKIRDEKDGFDIPIFKTRLVSPCECYYGYVFGIRLEAQN
jgi:hypothetical protein